MITVTALLASAALALPTTVSGPDDIDQVLDALPSSAWPNSVVSFQPNVVSFRADITPLEKRSSEGEEEVLSLASDILFAFDRADLSEPARTKIAELVADIPDGASVKVHGHTDSHGTDERNAELSLERAQSVADVIAEARPDLTLDIDGFGPDQPVEPNEINGEDNPEGRALNRRVEIRYDS